jgi:hypothetical protein
MDFMDWQLGGGDLLLLPINSSLRPKAFFGCREASEAGQVDVSE